MNKTLLSALRRLCWLAGLAAVGASASAASAQAELPETVRTALKNAGLSEEQFGAIVLPLRAKEPVVAHRPQALMQPASTLKVLTSAVALERLGANHRGFTELQSAAPVVDDVLQGDLVLKGGADPELGLPQLWALLAELRWAGIREIAGNVVLDRSLFRPARSDIGLPPFDEAPEFQYNVIPDALYLAGNLLAIEMISGERSMAVRITPPLERVEVVNELELVDAKCDTWDDYPQWRTPETTRVPGADGDGKSEGKAEVVRIRLHGKFPRLCTARAQLQLMDRTDLADRLVRYAWAQLGGVWKGQAVEGTAPAGARVLARRDARPWGEVVRVVNKRSDNPLTRILFLSLALETQKTDTSTPSAELATRVVRQWLADKGISSQGLVMENGSGLSRIEKLTPLMLARALQAALSGPYGPELLMSLPLGAVDTPRFANTAAAQRTRLKPGGLRNVGSLAGQVLDADGLPVVMVAIVNADRPARGRNAINALVEWITTNRFAQR
jgi:serine-type D-Ala-D-Ala carboxypeptidase/endopeptidase (penicillin-binding protein 4)